MIIFFGTDAHTCFDVLYIDNQYFASGIVGHIGLPLFVHIAYSLRFRSMYIANVRRLLCFYNNLTAKTLNTIIMYNIKC